MKETALKVSIKRIYLFFRAIGLNLIGRLILCRQRKELRQEKIKKILVIKLERIGDLVLSTPVLRELKRKFSNSYIAILVNDYNKDVVVADSNIDEVLIYRQGIARVAELAKLIKRIRSISFDLVVDLTGSDRLFLPVFISYLSKAGYTIGLNQFGRGFLFNSKVKYDARDKPIAELMFDIVKPLGIYSNNIEPRISVSQQAAIFAKELFSKLNVNDKGLLIGIHPGGYYPSQRWPEIGFAKVADEVIRKYAANVFIIGGYAQKRAVFKIASAMQNKPQGVITGITLEQLIGVIANLDILLCNNSGPLHIASALGIATVSTMGPTLPKRWQPQGKNHKVIRKDISCSPCNLGSCAQHKCMRLITPLDILEAVEAQLNNAVKKAWKSAAR